jgi:hypothetical protein
MIFRRMGWVPPFLGLASVVCGYFALKVNASSMLKTSTPEGMKPLAVLSVERPALGWLALALVMVGLLFQLVIELKRK